MASLPPSASIISHSGSTDSRTSRIAVRTNGLSSAISIRIGTGGPLAFRRRRRRSPIALELFDTIRSRQRSFDFGNTANTVKERQWKWGMALLPESHFTGGLRGHSHPLAIALHKNITPNI